MPKYKLKNGPAFEVVDGPLTGQKFEPGKTYTVIPEDMRGKFVEVKPKPAKAPAIKKDTDKGGS